MRFIHKYTKLEKVLILIFAWGMFFSWLKLFLMYSESQSEHIAYSWGIYAEWIIWEASLINPLFSNLNPIDKDISSLIFRGLMKYESWSIVDDIAVHTLSTDHKTYTFTLNEWIKWQDWEPLTIEDVYFTYHDIIQSPDFVNPLITEQFKGVDIKLIWNNSISFTLATPYKFFLTSLLIWIVPKHLLKDIPVNNLQLSEFNYLSPIWLWPYKLQLFEKNKSKTRITLSRFEDFYWPKPYIDTIEFDIFDSRSLLMQSIDNLTWIKPAQDKTAIWSMKIINLDLARYVAIFFNTQSKIFSNEKVRLWFQLATNKQEIIKAIDEDKVVDSPLLELKQPNWIFNYDKNKAQGALHESNWSLPSKAEIINPNHEDLSLDNSYFTAPKAKKSWTLEESIIIRWKVPLWTKQVIVNDYQLRMFKSWDTEFSYKASVQFKTLKKSQNNKFKLEIIDWNDAKKELETTSIYLASSPEELESINKSIANEVETLRSKQQQNKKQFETMVTSAKNSKFRINNAWESLHVVLVTNKNVPKYYTIASMLKEQWAEVWIDLEIKNLDNTELQQAVTDWNYDILLYWQTLWYNLDTYPYFHSSQSNGWLNFSRLKNAKVDTLIEQIRSSHEDSERQKNLQDLQKEFEKVIPAIFLYSPKYYYSIDNNIKWINISSLPNLNDRFSNISSWYINEKNMLKPNWKTDFIKWLYSHIINK